MNWSKKQDIVYYRQVINGKRRRIKRTQADINKALKLLKGGKCGVCGLPEPIKNKRLSIDHCHKTGKLRGVLCSTCNRTLGLLKDNPKILAKLLLYLLEN